MSQTKIFITDDEKKEVLGLHEIFRANPKAITQEQKTRLASLNDKAWLIAKNPSEQLNDRVQAHSIIKVIHEILGRKYDDAWIPKESGKAGNKTAFIASKDQRKQNCDNFISYIGPTLWGALNPYEQAMALAAIWGAFKS